MKPDLYLKCVLTVIAVCLAIICLRDLSLLGTAHAAPNDVMRVEIVSTKGDLPVKINDRRWNITSPIKVKIGE